MLVERYPPMSLFALVPKLLCDFEPVLRQLDTLLEDDELIQRDFVARISRRTQWAQPRALKADEPQLRPEQARTSDQNCRGGR